MTSLLNSGSWQMDQQQPCWKPCQGTKNRDTRVKPSSTCNCQFMIQRDCTSLLGFAAAQAQMCLTYFIDVRVLLQECELSSSWEKDPVLPFKGSGELEKEKLINTGVMNTPESESLYFSKELVSDFHSPPVSMGG